jgi:hypothetical protein
VKGNGRTRARRAAARTARRLSRADLNLLAEFIDTESVDQFLEEWQACQAKRVVTHAWSDAWSLYQRLVNVLTWDGDS